jgi:hypothetical protein
LLGQELLFVSAFRLYVEERLEGISLHLVLRFLAHRPKVDTADGTHAQVR